MHGGRFANIAAKDLYGWHDNSACKFNDDVAVAVCMEGKLHKGGSRCGFCDRSRDIFI